MPPLTKKNFAGGHFELRINGERVTSHIKSIDGGLVKAASTEEPMAAYHLRSRHASTRELEPITIVQGMSGARWALAAVESVINRREHQRYAGAVIHADANFVEQYSYEFGNALLTEVAFPKLDAKSKDFAAVTTKLQPETVAFKIGEGAKLQPGVVDKQKMWLTSAFRLTLDGYEAATEFTTSVEAISIKVNAKPMQTGGARLPEISPTKIEFSKLSFQVPLKYAKPLMDWYERSVHKVQGHDEQGAYETTGSLEFLDGSRRKTVYEIEFSGVGLEQVTLVKNDANQDATKLLKFDCYITGIKLKTGGAAGFI